MAVMTIRGLEDSVTQALKKRAKQEDASVNAVVARIIKEQLGLQKKPRAATYHDLDKLAGTWSDKDYLEFRRKVADFEKVDKEMWK
ncbi:MAG: antitoxin VapB family protein [Nitrospirota bacterium]